MTAAEKKKLWARFACTACRHYKPEAVSCEAFPKGIPLAVASGQLAHIAPIQGDHDIQFDPLTPQPESDNG